MRTIERGGVIAYPTEAVFGLGCDPFNENAVRRLLAIKKRPIKKGLILIASSMEQLDPFLSHLTSDHIEELKEHWPGPVSYVVPNTTMLPTWLRGEHSSIVFRVTNHPIAAAICKTWGGPIVSTSANVSGSDPAYHFYQMRKLQSCVDYVVPGATGLTRKPSRIVRLADGVILREG